LLWANWVTSSRFTFPFNLHTVYNRKMPKMFLLLVNLCGYNIKRRKKRLQNWKQKIFTYWQSVAYNAKYCNGGCTCRSWRAWTCIQARFTSRAGKVVENRSWISRDWYNRERICPGESKLLTCNIGLLSESFWTLETGL